MKKVRIGMIGCGNFSRHHGRMFGQMSSVQIVALCDTNQQNLDRYQREIFDPLNQRPPQFVDYREMLAKLDCDGVMIVTPHTQHFEQATASLDAGGHVLVEKPMVIGSRKSRALIAHANRVKRVLSVAFPGSFSPESAYIRALLKRGELGDVISVQGFVAQSWLKSTRGTWRRDPALSGGGFAYDSGAHLFHAMLYLTNLQPAEVFAWTDNRGAQVDILATAMIRFENRALGTAQCCGEDVRNWEEGITVSGTKGTVRCSIHGGRLEQWDAQGKLVRYPRVEPVPTLQQNFVDCILGRDKTPCPPVWGLRQALLMEALYKSAKTDKPAKVGRE
ncbi:MAG TPA: Gfo/Idh/MocA family oxidoreductase [Verrucomicrobiae bacterium]|nr:Gfo/Idh/MocA family oxidoreductase [Verrucomicrobiae bacterium]